MYVTLDNLMIQTICNNKEIMTSRKRTNNPSEALNPPPPPDFEYNYHAISGLFLLLLWHDSHTRSNHLIAISVFLIHFTMSNLLFKVVILFLECALCLKKIHLTEQRECKFVID